MIPAPDHRAPLNHACSMGLMKRLTPSAAPESTEATSRKPHQSTQHVVRRPSADLEPYPTFVHPASTARARPQAAWLTQQALPPCSPGWKSKVKQVRHLPPGSQTAIFPLCSHEAEGRGAPRGLFCKDTDSIRKGSTS